MKNRLNRPSNWRQHIRPPHVFHIILKHATLSYLLVSPFLLKICSTFLTLGVAFYFENLQHFRRLHSPVASQRVNFFVSFFSFIEKNEAFGPMLRYVWPFPDAGKWVQEEGAALCFCGKICGVFGNWARNVDQICLQCYYVQNLSAFVEMALAYSTLREYILSDHWS